MQPSAASAGWPDRERRDAIDQDPAPTMMCNSSIRPAARRPFQVVMLPNATSGPPSSLLARAMAAPASSLRTILVLSPRAGLLRGQAVGDHEVLELAVAARDGPLDLGLSGVVGDWRPVAQEPAKGRGTGHQGISGLHELEV